MSNKLACVLCCACTLFINYYSDYNTVVVVVVVVVKFKIDKEKREKERQKEEDKSRHPTIVKNMKT